jgi:hypothetical protein
VCSSDLGIFAVPGSKACLGLIKDRQEDLNTQRPVAEPLIVWARTESESMFQMNETSTNSSLCLLEESEGFIPD